ncbi:MAG: bifunctional demethylmenaquinone methyltransferase/2-methoxy-6-polyprenyl-1,4-benzoquinol methylase UbiE [Dissulfurispiraceae bacterium]
MMKTRWHPGDAFVKNIFSSIAPQIDFLSSLFCFCMDSIWRKRLVSFSEIKRGEKVLDVCTGTGKLAFLISREVGAQGSVVGADYCEEMLEMAKKNLGSASSDISFVLADAKNLTFEDNAFDVVTVAFGMRNIFETSIALREAYRVLKPGGRFFCLELTSPQQKWLMPFYNYYCFHIMPAVAKRILKSDTPYNYLPRSIQAFPAAGEFKQIIEKCDFSNVTVRHMSLGIATIFGARKEPQTT